MSESGRVGVGVCVVQLTAVLAEELEELEWVLPAADLWRTVLELELE